MAKLAHLDHLDQTSVIVDRKQECIPDLDISTGHRLASNNVMDCTVIILPNVHQVIHVQLTDGLLCTVFIMGNATMLGLNICSFLNMTAASVASVLVTQIALYRRSAIVHGPASVLVHERVHHVKLATDMTDKHADVYQLDYLDQLDHQDHQDNPDLLKRKFTHQTVKNTSFRTVTRNMCISCMHSLLAL